MLVLKGPSGLDSISKMLCLRVDDSIDDATVSDAVNATTTSASGASGTEPAASEKSSYSATADKSLAMGSLGFLGLLTTVASLS